MGEKFPAIVNPLLTQLSGVGPLHYHVAGQSVSSLVFVMQCALKLLEHLKIMSDIAVSLAEETRPLCIQNSNRHFCWSYEGIVVGVS
jgi:hypothetical protein